VRYEDQEKFFRRFAPLGLRRDALSSCYAMAETTFAVTQTPPWLEPTTLAVDVRSLSRDKCARRQMGCSEDVRVVRTTDSGMSHPDVDDDATTWATSRR